MCEAAYCTRYAQLCIQDARSNNREGSEYYSIKNHEMQVTPDVLQAVKTVSGQRMYTILYDSSGTETTIFGVSRNREGT